MCLNGPDGKNTTSIIFTSTLTSPHNDKLVVIFILIDLMRAGKRLPNATFRAVPIWYAVGNYAVRLRSLVR
jgi:hypothetical protein